MERTVLSVSYGHKAPLPHSRLFPAVPGSPQLSQPMPPSFPLIGGILMRGISIGLPVCQNHCPAMDGWPYLPLLKKKKKKEAIRKFWKDRFPICSLALCSSVLSFIPASFSTHLPQPEHTAAPCRPAGCQTPLLSH